MARARMQRRGRPARPARVGGVVDAIDVLVGHVVPGVCHHIARAERYRREEQAHGRPDGTLRRSAKQEERPERDGDPPAQHPNEEVSGSRHLGTTVRSGQMEASTSTYAIQSTWYSARNANPSQNRLMTAPTSARTCGETAIRR